MSLATRCTACGTIFRVVQDQLRVSEGWVRCGRCAEVFDAREQLFDIDREAPPPWPQNHEAADLGSAAQAPGPLSAAWPAEPAAEMPARYDEDEAPEQWQQPEEAASPFEEAMPPMPWAAEPASGMAPIDAQGLHDRPEPQWFDDGAGVQQMQAERVEPPAIVADPGPDVVLAPHLLQAKDGRNTAPAENATGAEPAVAGGAPELPAFMRPAQRRQGPVARVALALGSLLLLTLLGVQAARHFHDALASLHPPARPALQALCRLSGCELRPWKRIDAVSVESSALSQAGAGNQFQLTVSLRNKSPFEVALPWIELNLTDAAGTVVLRRMLAPSDFFNGDRPPSSLSLSAGADRTLQLLLSSGTQRVSGYSVEIFHP